jgi:hypothetical protein
MLTVPSAVLQQQLSNDRAFHVFFGNFWVMPLLIALMALPNGGRDWSRFTLVTLISGCMFVSGFQPSNQ